MLKSKKNYIHTNKDNNPSRFLVDLNSVIEKKEEDDEVNNKKTADKPYNKITDFKFKKPVNNFDNFFVFIKSGFYKISCFKNLVCPAFLKNKNIQRFRKFLLPLKSWHLSRQDKISRLAFFPLFKFLFLFFLKILRLFYKLCFQVGWAGAFGFRMALVLTSFILGLFFKIFAFAFLKNKKSFAKKASIGSINKNSFDNTDNNNFQPASDREREIDENIIQFIPKKIKVQKTKKDFIFLKGLKQATERVKKFKFNNLFFHKQEYRKNFLPAIPPALSSLPAREAMPDRKRSENKRFRIFPGIKWPSLRPALYFSLIIFILVLPLKAFTYYKDLNNLRGRVLGASEEAVGEMLTASRLAAQLDFQEAGNNFNSASHNFLKAKEEISEISGLLTILGSIIPSKEIKLAANADLILEAGRLSAELGNNLSLAFDIFSQEGRAIKDVINNFYKYGQKASRNAADLRVKVEAINSRYLPDDYQEQFIELQNKAGVIDKSLFEFVDILDKIKIFTGFDYDKRYLLVFQNNTEMRASGGFIGSYALVDFKDGEISNLEIPGGGSYDTEAGLLERIIAPEPLHIVNPLWHFWDANWWPDWPKTARKLAWFYERSDGPTVDGVIGFTPTVIERVLEVIGPVDMTEDYGVIIDADNFWDEVQRIAEEKPVFASLPQDSSEQTESSLVNAKEGSNNEDKGDIENTEYEINSTPNPSPIQFGGYTCEGEGECKYEPKKIIGDLMRKIIDELPKKMNKDILFGLAGVMADSLDEKHVLFYFNVQELQDKAKEFGWDGKIRETAWDYLMVINTNIAGGKSDKKIRETITHNAEVMSDGSIINTIEIKRAHTGVKNEHFTGVRNVDWMRIYVPEGSKLISASGFTRPDREYFEEPEAHWQRDPDVVYDDQAIIDIRSGTKIYDEAGKTVFANWVMVDPGQTATIYLKYKLPFKLSADSEDGLIDKIKNFMNPAQKQLLPYALLVQKQPGSLGSKIISALKLPPDFRAVWQYPAGQGARADGWQVEGLLDVDRYWAMLAEIEQGGSN